MSYSQNISRLKANSRQRLAERAQNNTNRATWDGKAVIAQADSLAAFSKTLGDNLVEWKKEQNKKDELAGVRQRQKDAAEEATAKAKLTALEAQKLDLEKKQKLQAEVLAEQEKRFRRNRNRQALEKEIETVRQMDVEYERIATEMTNLKGAISKPEADRLRNMSPHKQVGYVKEKLRVFKEALPDKVTHAMLTSEVPIQLEGLKPFTAKELYEQNIHNLPMKEAAVQALTDQIAENAGIYGYSDEMLEHAGVHDAIQKVKDDHMNKARDAYNIDTSDKQLMKAAIEYNNVANPDGTDVYLLFLKAKGGVDKEGNIRTNAQAWGEVHKVLVKAARHNPKYADKISKMELPEALRKQLGAKPGTTYGDQWPQRMQTLKSDIKKGFKETVDAENKYLKARGTDLENQLIQKQSKSGEEFTDSQLVDIAKKFSDLGLPVPQSILNYNNQSARQYDADKKWVEKQKGFNGGGLYPHDLQGLHPKLVGEEMKGALEFEKMEVGQKGAWGARAYEDIGGMLGITFKGLGMNNTARRKHPIFANAQDAAFKDFQRRYLEARSSGMTPTEAWDAVMDGPNGILADLKQGKNSTYVETTQERINRGRTEARELTERLDAVNDARQEIQPQLRNGEVYLRTSVLKGSEPYLAVLSDALTNGKPIYGLRASDEVRQALAYYNGVASSYRQFTGIQLLNWQIAAQKAKQEGEKENE